MKKIRIVIIALLLVIVTLFGFAGCGSDNQSESQNKIDELQSKIQELENKLSELDEHNKELNTQIKEMDGQLHDYYERIEKLEKELYGSYNEAGGFYEREANDYISATFSFMASSVYGYCISVEHYNKNLKFLRISEKKFKTLSNIFSYMPKMTHNTPLLIPGKIHPAPIKIPLQKSNINFITPPPKVIKIYSSFNKICNINFKN